MPFNVTGTLQKFLLSAALSVVTPQPAVSQAAGEAQALDAKVRAHFRAGQLAMQSGDFELASQEFRKVLKINPALLEARANLGLALYSLGEYEPAAANLARVTRVSPNLAGPNLFLGLSNLKLGLSDKAIPPLKRVVQMERFNLEARRALVACYLSQSRYNEAARESHALFEFQPNKAEGWYHLGKDYLQISTQLAARMASDYRESAWAHRLAGDVMALREVWKDAAGEYDQALKIQPDQAELHASLGRAYLALGKLPEAEAEFLRELQQNARQEEALLGLAELDLTKNDTAGARTRVEKFLEVYVPGRQHLPTFLHLGSQQAASLIPAVASWPSSRSKHFTLALLSRSAGQPQAMKEHFRLFEASRVDNRPAAQRPRQLAPPAMSCRSSHYAACAAWLQSKKRLDIGDWLMLGRARLRLNQLKESAEAFGTALAADKQNVEATYWLVRVYEALADGAFRQVEELFPDYWRVHQLRGEANKLRQAYDEAIKELRLAIQLQPNEPELHEALGHAYLLKTAYEEARRELERSLELDASRARALFLLGRLCLIRREEEKAIAYLRRAIKRDPGLLEARASLGTAYRRLGQPALAVPELEKASSQDFYGDLNYQLYLAYRDLRKEELAQQALARSQDLRRSSVARYRARIYGLGELE